MFPLFDSKKNPKAGKLETAILKHIMAEEKKKQREEDLIIEKIKDKKSQFVEYYVEKYEKKLMALKENELKKLATECLNRAVSYIRQLGAFLEREEITLYERVLGIMLYDLADSVQNLPYAIQSEKADKAQLRYELLLIIQFIHSYNDSKIQKEYLYNSFLSLSNVFPIEFFINND